VGELCALCVRALPGYLALSNSEWVMRPEWHRCPRGPQCGRRPRPGACRQPGQAVGRA